MKKITSLLLVLLLALACVSFSAAEDLTGTWYATEMSSEGISLDPASLGIEITLVINEDGTASLEMLGEGSQMNWKEENGSIVLFDDTRSLTLTFDGSALTMDMDGTAMKFERTAGEVFQRPAEVLAQDISDFNGAWRASKFGIGELYMDIELLAQFGLDLEESADILNATIENGDLNFFGSSEKCSFVDGTLYSETPGEDGAEPSTTRVVLLEGDMIEVTSDDALGLSFIFTRAN